MKLLARGATRLFALAIALSGASATQHGGLRKPNKNSTSSHLLLNDRSSQRKLAAEYYSPTDVVGITYRDNESLACAYYNDHRFSCGWTTHLGAKRKPHANQYTTQDGIEPSDIMGMAWKDNAKTNCIWLKNKRYSCNSRTTFPYRLPNDYQPENIVGIAYVDAEETVCAWYDDTKVSCGTESNLGSKRQPYDYTLPPGKSPTDIVDVAWTDKLQMACVWFKDGVVSCGRTYDLDSVRTPNSYRLPAKPKRVLNRVNVQFVSLRVEKTEEDTGNAEEWKLTTNLYSSCRRVERKFNIAPKENIGSFGKPQYQDFPFPDDFSLTLRLNDGRFPWCEPDDGRYTYEVSVFGYEDDGFWGKDCLPTCKKEIKEGVESGTYTVNCNCYDTFFGMKNDEREYTVKFALSEEYKYIAGE